MVGWLIYSGHDVEKNKRYIEFYIKEGKLQSMQIKLILIEKLEFGVRNNTWYFKYENNEIGRPDFAICRTIYPLLNKQLEYMGIKVFNNSKVAEICNDKARTYQYVAQLDIDMVDSAFVKNYMTEEAMNQIQEPSVIKAVAGHGGTQVFFLEPPTKETGEKEFSNEKTNNTTSVEFDKREILNGLNQSDIVLQPLTGSKHQDLRVYVIGKKIIAAILRTAKEGFKSNFSLGGDVREYHLSKGETTTVEKIISLFDFGLVGIDFIIGDKGELIFNEIEDVVGARMLYQCTDINLVRLYLDYIKMNL
ncbi:ATP-grasp domain-containing protein [Anaerocolumna sp.]|uniref:ATP-grasp domain-containing protein n=1 Tax=Anaerocolumna sp. TaxID=2041569 RepID=UPI0028AA4652|nr:ATP-grasp domain-containing protein [Anaerocolumna sp.]